MIWKILSVKGPDENLYFLLISKSKKSLDKKPSLLSEHLHLLINPSISFWDAVKPSRIYLRPLVNLNESTVVLNAKFSWKQKKDKYSKRLSSQK